MGRTQQSAIPAEEHYLAIHTILNGEAPRAGSGEYWSVRFPPISIGVLDKDPTTPYNVHDNNTDQCHVAILLQSSGRI